MQYATKFQIAVALSVIIARDKLPALVALSELHLGVVFLHLHNHWLRRFFKHILRLAISIILRHSIGNISLSISEDELAILVFLPLQGSPFQ